MYELRHVLEAIIMGFQINITTGVEKELTTRGLNDQIVPIRPHLKSKKISLKEGEILFIVGANGTGKSTLMGDIFRQNNRNSKRIMANRNICFDDENIGMSSVDLQNSSDNFRNMELQADARWNYHHFGAPKAKVETNEVIFTEAKLRDEIATFARNRQIAEMEVFIDENPSIITRINDIFLASNLKIQFKPNGLENILAYRDGGTEYNIARMSDGERNAFLIASSILTAPKNFLLLIDEPERHLHKSIVVPLLISVAKLRPDCTFVVSTHELGLPLEIENSKTIVLRNCKL